MLYLDCQNHFLSLLNFFRPFTDQWIEVSKSFVEPMQTFRRPFANFWRKQMLIKPIFGHSFGQLLQKSLKPIIWAFADLFQTFLGLVKRAKFLEDIFWCFTQLLWTFRGLMKKAKVYQSYSLNLAELLLSYLSFSAVSWEIFCHSYL